MPTISCADDNSYCLILPVAGRYDVKRYTPNGYGPSSVLAGQTRIQWVESFDTLEEAKAKYPEAELSNEILAPRNTFNHLPDPDGPDPYGDNEDAFYSDWD